MKRIIRIGEWTFDIEADSTGYAIAIYRKKIYKGLVTKIYQGLVTRHG